MGEWSSLAMLDMSTGAAVSAASFEMLYTALIRMSPEAGFVCSCGLGKVSDITPDGMIMVDERSASQRAMAKTGGIKILC